MNTSTPQDDSIPQEEVQLLTESSSLPTINGKSTLLPTHNPP